MISEFRAISDFHNRRLEAPSGLFAPLLALPQANGLARTGSRRARFRAPGMTLHTVF